MWFQINQLRSYQRILVYDKSFSLDALKLFSSSLSFIRLPKKCLSGDFLEVILIFVFWAAHMFRLNIYSKLGNISFIISLFFSDDLPLFFCFFFFFIRMVACLMLSLMFTKHCLFFLIFCPLWSSVWIMSINRCSSSIEPEENQ